MTIFNFTDHHRRFSFSLYETTFTEALSWGSWLDGWLAVYISNVPLIIPMPRVTHHRRTDFVCRALTMHQYIMDGKRRRHTDDVYCIIVKY